MTKITPLERTPRIDLGDDELRGLQDFAIGTVMAAGQEVLTWFRERFDVDNKLDEGRFDPVTVADRRGEEIIRNAIEQTYPSHGILGEEYGHKPGNGLTWLIDPIDGTRAFMTGMLHWGVLLALFDGQQPVIGVMYQPFTTELFYGRPGLAEYRHGSAVKTLTTRRCASLSDAVLATTSPEFYPRRHEWEAFVELQQKVKLTRFGGDCYLFAMVAMGHIDLAIEAMLDPYDIQALIPIIHGAGGVVTDWNGGDASMGGHVIAAGDPAVHALALEYLRGT